MGHRLRNPIPLTNHQVRWLFVDIYTAGQTIKKGSLSSCLTVKNLSKQYEIVLSATR